MVVTLNHELLKRYSEEFVCQPCGGTPTSACSTAASESDYSFFPLKKQFACGSSGKCTTCTLSTACTLSSINEDEDESVLLHVDDIPSWHFRPYIINGYRPVSCVSGAMSSIFSLHNETGNIWTHLLPFFYVFAVMIDYGINDAVRTDVLSNLMMMLLWGALLVLYGCSSIYHTMSCGSECVAGRCLLADISAIACYVSTCSFAMVYFGFFHHPELQMFYLAWSCVAVGLLVGPVVCGDGKPNTIQFICSTIAVSSAVVPFTHLLMISTEGESMIILPLLINTFGSLAIGAIFYGTHFPECRFPGRFDYLGQSHQYWHVFIGIGCTAYAHGILNLHRYHML